VQAVPSRQPQADHGVQGIRLEGRALRHAGPRQPGPGRKAPRAGPERYQRPLAFLRADGRHRAHGQSAGGGSPMSISLHTKYLGLDLKNPLVASSGPLTGRIDTLKKLEEAGAAAVVLPSLFEEEIVREGVEIAMLYDYQNEGFGQAKQSLTIPVIGSLNGTSNGGWIQYGKMIEEAGADALELNIYYLAADPEMTAQQVEEQYLELVASVRGAVS